MMVYEYYCISLLYSSITMQRFNNSNYTQKHYKVPDDGIKPKLVARNNKNYIYQTYYCPLTEINIYICIYMYTHLYSFIISTMGCPLSKEEEEVASSC